MCRHGRVGVSSISTCVPVMCVGLSRISKYMRICRVCEFAGVCEPAGVWTEVSGRCSEQDAGGGGGQW